jgi:hypothetical protein
LSVEGDHLSVEGDHLSVEGDHLSVEGDHLSVEGDHLSVEGDVLSVEGNHLSVEGDHLSVEGDHLTVEGDHLSVESDHLLVEGDCSSVEGDLSSVEGVHLASRTCKGARASKRPHDATVRPLSDPLRTETRTNWSSRSARLGPHLADLIAMYHGGTGVPRDSLSGSSVLAWLADHAWHVRARRRVAFHALALAPLVFAASCSSQSAGSGSAAGVDAGGDASPMGSCGAPTQRPAPCTQWRIAGSDTVVSGSYDSDGGFGQIGFSLSSLVRSGNGALIAWTTVFYSSSTPTFWGTRALNIDGTPRSAIVSHTPTPVTGAGDSAFMSLAVTPQCAFGGLASASDNTASGCNFFPLDGDGKEIGPVVSLPSGANKTSGYCTDLGPAPDGFTYLQQAPNNGGTSDLVTVGSNGSLRLRQTLGTFPGFNPGRLVLDDESFLLTTAFETDAANDYTWEVAHYDASGVQIAPGTTVATSERLDMAETSSGVLAAYVGSDPANQSGQALYVVPLSRDGVPMATPVALPVTGAVGRLFGFSLDPSPSGDAILNWINFDGSSPTSYRFFATELDPGGRQRGPVLDLGTLDGFAGGSILVSADGERALLVYSISPENGPATPTGGVHALPLACATH